MIIDSVTIDNFGIFGGHQTIDLTPTSTDTPITLIGGVNGRGKTTFVDAVQLCLFGKFADCSNRGKSAYKDYLRKSIHSKASPREAHLCLNFRHKLDGVEQHYQVTRAWRATSNEVVERFEVLRDGKQDTLASSNWFEFVESIFPRRIANLFFFDGERVETYASVENARELLKTATSNLLGLDLVDQLAQDLEVVQTRKERELKNKGDAEALAAARTDYEILAKERTELVHEIARIKTHELPKREREIRELEQQFQASGAETYERQGEIEQELRNATKERRNAEDTLREIAAEETPLLMLVELMAETCGLAEKEVKARQATQVLDTLKQRDAKLLKILDSQEVPANVRDALLKFTTSDLAARAKDANVHCVMDRPDAVVEQSRTLARITLSQCAQRAESALARYSAAVESTDELERRLASIPAEESVREIIEQRKRAKADLQLLKDKIKGLEEQLQKASHLANKSRQRVAKLLEKKVRDDFENENTKRTITHAQKVAATLNDFRAKVLAKHIQRIEHLVTQRFQDLVGKDDLVAQIKIDPDDFSISLFRRDDKEFGTDRLSAGERQLLATAILWALAQASNKQLPTIIDTPLGRLDSQHRDNLVVRYFPYAGHQVILLSTDEEISPAHLKRLARYVGRNYTLRYNPVEDRTEVRDGYFSEGAENAA